MAAVGRVMDKVRGMGGVSISFSVRNGHDYSAHMLCVSVMRVSMTVPVVRVCEDALNLVGQPSQHAHTAQFQPYQTSSQQSPNERMCGQSHPKKMDECVTTPKTLHA